MFLSVVLALSILVGSSIQQCAAIRSSAPRGIHAQLDLLSEDSSLLHVVRPALQSNV